MKTQNTLDRPHQRPTSGPLPIQVRSNGNRPPTDDPLTLVDLRTQIEEADQELIRLIARRCHLARAVGERKKRDGLPVVDPAREARVVRAAAEEARAHGIDEAGVRQIVWCLIGLARQAQQDPSRSTAPSSGSRLP